LSFSKGGQTLKKHNAQDNASLWWHCVYYEKAFDEEVTRRSGPTIITLEINFQV
jgi:hypothetical protein